MHIKKIRLSRARCLRDFEMELACPDGGGSSAILIGENGMGKSTLLEKIIEIFMSFDSDAVAKRIDYDYEITYRCRGKDITIKKEAQLYTVEVSDKVIAKERSMKDLHKALDKYPGNIFPKRFNLFYSGYNDKLAQLMKPIDQGYSRKCTNVIRQFIEETNAPREFPERKYNYCDDSLTGIYLISIFGPDSDKREQDNDDLDVRQQGGFDVRQALKEHCGIGGITSFRLSMDLNRFPMVIQNAGKQSVFSILYLIDPRLAEVLQKSYIQTADDTLLFDIRPSADLSWNIKDKISVFNFFEKLVTLYHAQYTIEVEVGGVSVDVRDLSEGQRQIIKLLGMLTVCGDEDSFVVMDEPDAHMNPKWKYSIKSILDEALGVPDKKETQARPRTVVDTQALVVTHDPLVVNGVDQDHIRIFSRKGEKIRAVPPEMDTVGMGIDGLLQSSCYGLRTSYDKKADKLFCRRQELYLLAVAGQLSEQEEEELISITEDLSNMHISMNSVDFLYDDFLMAYRRSKFYKKDYLTYTECLQRSKAIKEIIDGLFQKRGVRSE